MTNLKNAGVEYVEGEASFENKNTIKADGKSFSAKHIVVASGATAPSGNFKGAEHCITSDGVFAMDKLPKSISILGAGYIGVEMAGIMASFGVETTLVARS